MRVYLDNCCFNRPYDSRSQMRVPLETQAKLYIQDLIKSGELEREKFDYTKWQQDLWQQDLFEGMTLEEMKGSAATFSQKNPL